MSGHYGEYYDLAQRVENNFHEIDSAACADLRDSDAEYAALWMESASLQNDFPVIDQMVEGSGAVSLSPEEHAALVRYLELGHDMQNMERKLLYFRGHTDNYAYLQMISGIVVE